MIMQLFIGTVLIALTVLVNAGFVGVASYWLLRSRERLARAKEITRFIVHMFCATLWLLLGLTIAVWIWAAAFMWLGVFQDFELSLYFAVVAFTTLGFGDIILNEEWRLLSGLAAANGLILFSLCTALLIEFLMHARGRRAKPYTDDDLEDQ